MTAEPRFCEECGSPLSPGVRFCEECGSPVRAPGGKSQPADGREPVPAPADRPIDVIPFAHTHGGLFSVRGCTLVVYPDRCVLAYVPSSREPEMERARSAIERALEEGRVEAHDIWVTAGGPGMTGPLFDSIGVPERPWEAYSAMPPGEILAEDPRNRAVFRDAIVYVRGERDGDTGTEQVMVRTPDEVLTLYCELGTFFSARNALVSLVEAAPGTPEAVFGVIPFGNEPQVDGFGFQYVWNLVVTDRRIIYCMIEDEEADEAGAWLDAREQETRAAGRDWREGEEAGRSDAPWQRRAATPVSRLLETDVNFFLPLGAITEVQVEPGGRRRGDTVRFALAGGELSLIFPDGTAAYASSVLERALPERVR